MRALFFVGRGVFLAQRQEIRDIGVVKLIDFGNGRPGLDHSPANRAP